MPEKKNTTLTIVLPQELKDAAVAQAKAEDTSLSRLIRMWLKTWLSTSKNSKKQ